MTTPTEKPAGVEDSVDITVMTTAHNMGDTRITARQCTSLASRYSLLLMGCDDDPAATPFDLATSVHEMPNGRLGRLKRVVDFVRDGRGAGTKVVHLHDPELFLAVPILRRRGHRVVIDLHEDYPKQVSHNPRIPSALHSPARRAVRAFVHRISRLADGVVVASPEIADTLPVDSYLVQNFPRLDEFGSAPSWREYEARPSTVFSIGTNTPERAFLEMVDANEIVVADTDARVIIAGPVHQESARRRMDSAPGIEFPGRCDRAEVKTLLGMATVGLCLLHRTPQYEEARPTKLFEYMLAGLPVVASDFGPTADIVTKFDCGILVDPRRPDQIASAITGLVNDPETAWRLGQNGRAAVEKHFVWDTEEAVLYDLYARLCDTAQ